MRRTLPADWLFVLAWGAAVAPAIFYLRDLSWPCDVDGLRDLASAQAIANGHWLSDPLYAGEAAWYTPLVPALIALTSIVGRVTIPRAYVLTGLWLNGLIPLGFFLCARRLLGSTTALAATAIFLFLPSHPAMWAAGTYSPWVFPAITAQLPFFLGILAWHCALDTPRRFWLMSSGVLLAITFLAHGAPALVLAGIVAFSTLATMVRPVGGVPPSVRAKRLLAVAVTSLLLVMPFLASLGLHYHFKVLNRDPATWIDPDAQPTALFNAAFSLLALPHWAIAVAGLWWIRRHVNATGQRLLLGWPLAATAGYIMAVLSETVTAVPALAPAYHYTYLFRSFEAMLAGCGIVAVAELVAEQLRRLRIGIPSVALAVTATILLAVALYPQFLRREVFERAHNFSANAEELPEVEVYRWIREHVPPGAVFVAQQKDALGIVGPAGHSAISVDNLFANPYVNPAIRENALTRMTNALIAGDVQDFEVDREHFHVTHVLARGDQAAAMTDRSHAILTPILHRDTMTVFSVHPPTP